jgi:hypothetical protein
VPPEGRLPYLKKKKSEGSFDAFCKKPHPTRVFHAKTLKQEGFPRKQLFLLG